jgi:hypothetical protein
MEHTTLGILASTFGSAGGELIRVGRLVRISREARPIVDFEGNALGPLEARTVIECLPTSVRGDISNLQVLLLFERGDFTLPIIIGIVRETFAPTRSLVPTPDKIVLDALDEVVIRTGKSSLSLHRNGDVITKGTRIVSRASRTNKLRGAEVKIN